MSLLRGSLYLLAYAVAVSIGAKSEVTPQIIGGSDSEVVPYQVSMRGVDWHHICGATIINLNWVLTAGHCTVPSQNPKYIVAGTNCLNGCGNYYNITLIRRHSSFNSGSLKNDIAVCKVYPQFIMGQNIATIPLAGVPSVGTTVNVAGWGWTNVSLNCNCILIVNSSVASIIMLISCG